MEKRCCRWVRELRALPSSGRWRLVLSPGARKLVVTYFIVGAMGLVAYIGILVALPCVASYNYLQKRVNDLMLEADRFGRTLIAMLAVEA